MTQPQPVPPPEPAPEPVVAIFHRIIQHVLVAVANRGRPDSMRGPALDIRLLDRIMAYLFRVRRRFTALLARMEAGTLRPLPETPRVRKTPVGETVARKPRKPHGLPRHRKWLIGLIGYQAAPAKNWLQLLLNDPRMEALILAEPRRMARLLRPVCHAFGVYEWPDVFRRPSDPAVPLIDREARARESEKERAARAEGRPYTPPPPPPGWNPYRLPRFVFYVTRRSGVRQPTPA